MHHRWARTLVFVLIFQTAFPFAVRGEATSSAYLRDTTSVRQSSLGGFQSAAFGETADMLSNPAALNVIAIPELVIAHTEDLIQTNTESLSFGYPHHDQAFGVSGRYIDYGSQERIGIDGSNEPVEDLGHFKYSTTLAGATWARKLGPRSHIGVQGKVWSENRDQTSARGWAADAGVLIPRLWRGLDVGMVARNIGPSVDSYSLPTTLSLGLGFRPFSNAGLWNGLVLLADSDLYAKSQSATRLGVEMDARNVWLRAGFNSGATDDPLGHYTFGGGLRVKGWRLDYAWQALGDLGSKSQISLTLGFGLTPAERERAALDVDAAMQRQIRESSKKTLAQANDAFSKGDFETAKEQLTQSLMWDPLNDEAQALLKTVNQKQTFAEANEYYQRGKQNEAKEQWLEAAFQMQQALRLVPNHQEAQAALKTLQKRIRSTQAAQKDPVEVLYSRGVELYLTEQYEGALAEWQRAEALAPDFPRLREYIEKAKNKKLEKEVKTLRQRQKNDQQELNTLSQQAYSLYSLGQTEKAIALWERVVALDPSNKDAATALERARSKLKLVRTASPEASAKAAQLNVEALRAYAVGRIDKAAELWKQALELEPTNQRMRKNLEHAESELEGQKAP